MATLPSSHLKKISNDIINIMSASTDNSPRGSRKVPKSNVDIKIDNHFGAKVYTSGSSISGHVVINHPRDVPFDDFEIIFIGTAATRVDFVNQYATYSHRPFLKLRMPIRAADFPNPRVFKAGEPTTSPSTSHRVENEGVREQHLRLPPSMGYWEENDQAPEMAQIEYAIKARAYRETAEEGKTVPLQGEQLLKVMPSLPEDAPFDITAADERYRLSKTKAIRKNIFSTKSGKLTATASQPSAIMLSADAYRMSESALRIKLEFDPASPDAAPPKINSIAAKLEALTFFSSAPMEGLPNLGGRVTYRVNPALNYSTTNPLTMAPLETVSWAKEEASTSRRDSGYSSTWAEGESSESDSSRRNKSAKSPTQHVATLDIPFALPTQNKKFFLPSFHTCLISRSYILHLTLSVGPMNTNISLNVPLQVAVEQLHAELRGDDLPSFESAMAQAEEEAADMHLSPRLMQVPSGRFQGNSSLPGYENLSHRLVPVA
ncbi:hypothetical protein G7046_g7886 [Stylonectria norvegica]|nr:hypothetical protein G7046_g7886 [Stylonectria norvegica]